MKTIRRAVSAFGGIFFAALLIAALAPKATRGIAAALVQVVGNVSVANPTDANGNPVAVVTKDVDSPIHSPFDIEASCAFAFLGPFNKCVASEILTVPAGQVARIEYVSIFCEATGGPVSQADLTVDQQFGPVNPSNPSSMGISDHYLALPGGSLPLNTGFGQTVNLYVAGTTPHSSGNGASLVIAGDATTSGICLITLNGYMAPQ